MAHKLKLIDFSYEDYKHLLLIHISAHDTYTQCICMYKYIAHA